MLKKILYSFGVLLTISVVAFAIIKLSPGDPAENYLRASHLPVTQANLNKTREDLGLNKPVLEQYIHWIKGAIKLDFGYSYMQKKPVHILITNALLPSLQLGFFSLVFLLILSPLLGSIAAIYKNKPIDYLLRGISYIFVSVPKFWIGYILIIVFAVWIKILPVSGRGDIKNYILPSATFVLPLLAQNIFFIRKSLLEEMEKVHVESAILRGVSRKRIVMNHLLRNTMIPIVTVFGSNVMYLISGAVLIEEIFSWPGLGKLFTSAVRLGDLPTIQAMLLLFGLMSIIINGMTQLIVKMLNPRLMVREGSGSKK